MNWLIGKILGAAVTASTPARAVLLAKVLVWLGVALLAAITLFGGLYWARGLKIDALTATVEAQEQALAAAQEANASNLETIRRLAEEMQRRKTQNENLNTAMAEIEEARRGWILSMQAEMRKMRGELEAIYASDAECAALRRVPVCGPLTDRVRGQESAGAD